MPSSAAEEGSAPGPALTLLAEVRWRGMPVTGERTHALLAALAATPGEGAGESRLIEEIWGDDVPANPTKALQVVVSRARAATSAEVVVRTPHGYRLGTADTDVDRLRAALREARDAERAADWAAAAAAARNVVDLAVADTGEGELAALRETARAARSAARLLLGRALSVLGHHEEALRVLDGAAPDEPTLLALLRSEAAVHGTPAALERYEQVREHYAERLGVDLGPELQALHLELLARDRPVREGLLYEASRLIGRDDDIASLSEMIRTSRVVSIVGAGGLGKTRLAHLMGRLAEQPVVHFVELAGVTSPEGVATEVGDVLGVRESVTVRLASAARRTDLVSRIVDQVGTTPALLVLDNCEHLVDAVAELVQVLITRTPALRVLTTSRAPLGIAAERVYQLPQLDLDDAVELFTERATAARPGARLDPPEVRALVARLDGLPLAVELAAAKVRAMSVGEIGRRLENRFALLRGGSRDAPERHQTLLAVIDWSWNLLDDEQRVALRRLSVFRDGFSLAGADALIDGDALVPISSLVDQSLVTVVEGADEVRYRLLETVREFGQMQLVDAGDDAETLHRFRRWGVDFALAAGRALFGPEQVTTMRAIRSEEGNLVDLLRQCLRTGDADGAVALVACLSDFWTIEGSHLKVVGIAPDVEDLVVGARVGAEVEEALRTTLVAIAFNTLIFSDSVAGRSVDRLDELGPGAGRSRGEVAATVLLAARRSVAEERLDAIEALCDDDNRQVAQVALMWSCQLHENQGDLRRALDRGRRALALADDADGPWNGALVRAQLAGLTMQIGEFEEAIRYADEAIPVMAALGAHEDVAQLKGVRAIGAMEEGRIGEAERIFEEIEADDSAAGIFGAAIILLCGRPELDLAAGRVETGLRGYREAVATLSARRFPGLEAMLGFEPWTMYAEAAAIAAHVHHEGRAEVEAMRADLLRRAPELLTGAVGFLDYPVFGSVLFALALWELGARPEPEAARRAVRLLVLAERFGYNRQLPSLSWAGGVALAEAAQPGELARVAAELEGRAGPDLRDEAGRLLAEIATPGR